MKNHRIRMIGFSVPLLGLFGAWSHASTIETTVNDDTSLSAALSALVESGSNGSVAETYDWLMKLVKSGKFQDQFTSLVTTGTSSTGSNSSSSSNGSGNSSVDAAADAVADPKPTNDHTVGKGGEPMVRLSAPDVVKPGTGPRLSWESSATDRCTASGGWSGSKSPSGSETLPAITEETTYTLTCEGADGSAMAMMSVDVTGVVTIKWERPAANVDGSALSGLSGYRIYYGSKSGDYSDLLTVKNPDASEHALELPSGEYYLAMTAVDRHGRESARSNEVVRVVE